NGGRRVGDALRDPVLCLARAHEHFVPGGVGAPFGIAAALRGAAGASLRFEAEHSALRAFGHRDDVVAAAPFDLAVVLGAREREVEDRRTELLFDSGAPRRGSQGAASVALDERNLRFLRAKIGIALEGERLDRGAELVALAKTDLRQREG